MEHDDSPIDWGAPFSDCHPCENWIKVKTGIKRSAKYVDKVKQLVRRDAAL